MANDGAVTIVGNQNATVTDGNNSLILAGNGNDTLTAGNQSVVVAGNGSDKVTVGANSAVVVGNGNDTLTAGANSVIVAGNGNDTLYLGASDTAVVGHGKDTFVFQPSGPITLTTPTSLSVNEDGSIAFGISVGASGFGFGHETIVGFDPTKDRLQFDTSQFANFAAVTAASRQVGGNTVITGDTADTILLSGVRLSSLTASDFLFVTGASSSANITVTISGIPSGVTLSDSAGPLTVTNGSVTLTAAQLAGLTLHAGEDTSATLTVVATNTTTGASVTHTVALTVNPVAEPPSLAGTATSLTVAEGASAALPIVMTPKDGDDTVSITVAGLPSDAALNHGTKNPNGTWTLTAAQLSGLQITAGEDTTATLTVTATNSEGPGASTSQTISLTVGAVGEAPSLAGTSTSVTVQEGASAALPIAVTPKDGDDTVSIAVAGLPSDAALNHGSKNLNGTWTLTPADLAGLQITAGEDTVATLTVTATNSEGPGASTSQTISLTVSAVGEAPSLAGTSTSVTAQEGASAALPIVMTPKDGDDTVSITVSGVPTGATLSAGTSNGNGTWTLTPADLAGLQITAGEDTVATLTVTATNSEGPGASTSQTISLTVSAVGEAPSLAGTSTSVTVQEGASAALPIVVTPKDGDDTVSITLAGLPSDATLNHGSKSLNGSWTLAPADLTGLQVTTGEDTVATLTVTATNSEGPGASTSQTIGLTISPVGEAPSLTGTATSLTLAEGATATLPITVTPKDGDDAISITVAGLPSDAALNHGSKNLNGSWTLAPADLTGLQITAGEDTVATLTVTATNSEGPGASISKTIALTVSPVAEAPSLAGTTTSLTLTEGATAALPITMTAQDGDDTVTITVAGLPSDAALNYGTKNLDGSWTLTPGQLTGLQITAGEDTGATLTVTATNSEGPGAATSQTIGLTVSPVGEAPSLAGTVATLMLAEGATAALPITLTAQDGDDTVTITVAGLPSDAALNYGTKNLDGSWTLTPGQLTGLQITAGEDTGATLTVTATNSEGPGASVSKTIALTVSPVAEAPSLVGTTTSLTLTEGAAAALPITTTAQDGDDTVSITVTGLPSDATLNHGSKNLDGSWTLTPGQLAGLQITAGEDTSATLTVTATNSEGPGASVSQTISLTINPDTQKPTITFDTAAFTDTGVQGDHITRDGHVTLSGTVSDSESIPTVQVFNGGTPIGPATVTNGTWTLSTVLAQGSYGQLNATATNEDGNTSNAATSQAVQVDTTPPAVTFDEVSFIDTGVQGDRTTNNGAVFLSGAVTDNVAVSQVQVFNGLTPLGTATVDGTSHTWSLTATLGQGVYDHLNVTATDEAGNTTNATTSQTVQVDTAAPAITFDTVAFTDTGVQGDHITSNGSVTLSGTTSDNVMVAQVEVFNGATSLGLANVSNVNHTWSLTTALGQGIYGQLNATATDEAGNATNAITAQSVQVDTTAPAITFDMVAFTDTGVPGDHITSNGSVTLSGTTSDNVTVSQVQVFNGATPLGLANVNNTNRTWNLTTSLGQGTYNQLNATATDEAGNTTNATTAQTLQVDTTAPAITFDTVSFTDTGVQGDHITSNGSVTLSGTTFDDVTVSQVQVFNGATLLGTAIVDNVHHTWTFSTSLSQGIYNQLSATATDEAGNATTATTAQSVQVDTTAPTISFDTVAFNHAGTGGDNVSNDGLVTFSGTVADNVTVSSVNVFNGGTLIGQAGVSNGVWTLSTTLTEGVYNQLSATAADEAGNTSTAGTKRVVTISPVSGNVIDGYIAGATVFADSNHNGVLDSGEASGTTDASGHFVLGPGSTSGPLVLIGGTDTATNLPFTGVLTAPTGSTQVTPLTTLVQAVAAANGGNVGSASQAVATALGINPNVDLTTLDPLSSAYAGNTQAFVAASSVLNTVSMVASAVSGAGASFSAAASGAFSALASQITSLPTGQTLDLTSSAVVSSTLTSVASTTSTTLDPNQTSGIVTVVTSVNNATQTATGTSVADLLTNVSATSIVAQGSASSQLQQATSGSTSISTVVANNTGSNLSSSVSTAVNNVGSVAPAPPQILGLTPTDASPTNATLVHYTLAFSDPVMGVTTSAFSLSTSGMSGASIASVTPVAGTGGAQYTIAVNTGSGDGTVALDFAAGTAVTDLAGTSLSNTSTVAGPAYTVDQDAGEQGALSLSVTDALVGAAGASTVHFTVGGLEADDAGTVTLSDGAHQVTVSVSGAQTSYAADLTTLNDGPIISQLTLNGDAAGNSFAPVGGNIITLDRDTSEQNVTSIITSGAGIGNGSGDLNSGKTVTLAVNLGESVTLDTTGGAPTLTLNDGGIATYAGPSSSNTTLNILQFTYTVQLGQNTADLAVSSLNLNGATAVDAAGNVADLSGANNYNPAGILQIDTTAPSLTSITQSDPASTNASFVHYAVAFSEPVTGVNAAAFSLTTTGVTGASIAGVAPVAGSGATQYVVTVGTGSGSGTVALNVTSPSAVQDLASNPRSGGTVTGPAYTITAPPPPLWSTSTYPAQVATGDHLYGPAIGQNGATISLSYGDTATNYNVNGPDTVTQHFTSFDPYLLQYRGGDQIVATYNIAAFPFSYSTLLPVTLIGNTSARQFQPIIFFVSEDQNGTPTINRTTATQPFNTPNGSLTFGAPTAIETLPAGTALRIFPTSFTNDSNGLITSYDVAWDQFNAQAHTYQVNVQMFNPGNSTASPVTQLFSQTGVTGVGAELAWQFRSASGQFSPNALISAVHDVPSNSDVLKFQGYALGGATTTENWQVTPDLSHYAAGATSSIVQEVVNPPTRTGTPSPLLFTPNAPGAASTYSAAWNETVTDSTGTHYQVEFAMFNANSSGGTGSVKKQVTFQIADGKPQQIRVGSFNYLGSHPYEVLAYGDSTATNVVEFDGNGNQVASFSEATNQFFGQLEVFGDGRIGITYDNVLDGSGTSQFTTHIYDLRTTGIAGGSGSVRTGQNSFYAGTQFNDNVVAPNAPTSLNNTYYFVGRNTAGQGPSDSFTGGTGAWNTAIFAGASTNYTVTTTNGVTTITNVGDPTHAGSLTATNVQELAFGPTADVVPTADGTVVVSAGTAIILGHDSGTEAFTIDAGATLKLAVSEAGTVTFAGAPATLVLGQPASFTGHLAGLADGDVIDLANTQVASASISGSTLTVNLSGGGALTYQVSGASEDDLQVQSDGAGGTNLVMGPFADAPSLSGTATSVTVSEGAVAALPIAVTQDGDDVVSIIVAGLPTGATLSAGTNNGGGSWTLTSAQLAGLQITGGEDTTATLTVTATNSEHSGASASQTIALTVSPVAEAPSLTGTAMAVTVSEGLTTSLPITMTPQDGDDAVSVTVTGVPTDATLSAGINNGGGSWTLTAAQLVGLQITAGEDTTATLTVAATNSEGPGATTSQTIALTVNPVAESPSLAGTATTVTVGEGATTALPIAMTAHDGDDTVSISVTGVPTDATLSAGNNNGGGSWTLTPAQLAGLQITAGEDTTATLTVTAINSEGPGASASQTIALTVSPVAEAPSLAGTATSVTLSEGATVALPIAMTPLDGDDTVSITVTGVPAGATLSAGTNNGGGSWTLTPAQLAGLQITGGEGTTTTLTVTASNSEGPGASASQQIALTVSSVAEAPSVTAPSSLTVTDGGSVRLNIGVTATDGDDTLGSVTISGVPTDATLSAGTNNGNGSWTLTPAQLAGLTLTAGPHSGTAAHTLGTLPLTITATASDPGAGSATSAPSTINLTIQPMLWSSVAFPAQTTVGTHLYGPFISVNGGVVAMFYGTTATNYTDAGPDSITNSLLTLDPFLLPYHSGIQTVNTSTITAFPSVRLQMIFPTLNAAGTSIEGVGFYVTEDQAGTATINKFTFTDGSTGLNGAVPIGGSTAVESGLIGSHLQYFSSFTNGPGAVFTGTGASYSLAWAQYNSATQSYTVDFQIFSPSGTTSGPLVHLINATGIASETSAPAWFFRGAGTNGSGTVIYGAATAKLDTTTGHNYIQFQSYTTAGATTGPSFQVLPNLNAYAAGATNRITQEPTSVNHTGAAVALQYAPNIGALSGFSFAWNETVTDTGGTHDQVEFAIYKPPASNQPPALLSQSTFQIADGNPQNVRVATTTVSGTNVAVLAYGDATGTHVVEFDQSTGNKIASLFDASTQMFGQLTAYGDGRIGLVYDNVVDANGTTQYVTHVYDLRTSGLNLSFSSDSKDKYIAGTQFNDTVVGENNVNNTYYYVGQSTNGSGPTDSFTGGTGGWNVAVLPDARSSYTITTLNGVTTLVNTGDPAHAGTLNVTGVQALAFAPTMDPSGNAGALEATGDTLDILGPLPGGGEPITIDNGSTLELNTPDNGTVTFAGPTGTLKIDTSSSFTGTVGGQLAIGDVLDFADITAGANATIGYSGNNSPGTLTVSDGAHTASFALTGNYSLANFTPSSDGHGGTSVVDPPIAPADPSIALLRSYMASSFVTTGDGLGGTALTDLQPHQSSPIAAPH